MPSISKYEFIIPAVLGTLLIIYASSMPDISIVSSNNSLDRILSNLAHIPAFALLAFLWFRAFPKTQKNKPELLVIVGLILFAISDEFHQSMIPGRTAAVSDFVLDLIGIFLGFAAYKAFDRINMIDRMSSMWCFAQKSTCETGLTRLTGYKACGASHRKVHVRQ